MVRLSLRLGLQGSAAALLGCALSHLRESWLALYLWAPWARAWGWRQGLSNSREQWGWLLYGGFTDIVGLSVGYTGTTLTSLGFLQGCMSAFGACKTRVSKPADIFGSCPSFATH